MQKLTISVAKKEKIIKKLEEVERVLKELKEELKKYAKRNQVHF